MIDLNQIIDDAYEKFIRQITDEAFLNAIVEKITHQDAVILFKNGIAEAEIIRVRLKVALEDPG